MSLPQLPVDRPLALPDEVLVAPGEVVALLERGSSLARVLPVLVVRVGGQQHQVLVLVNLKIE